MIVVHMLSKGEKVKKPLELLTLKAFTYLAPRPGLEPGTYGLTGLLGHNLTLTYSA